MKTYIKIQFGGCAAYVLTHKGRAVYVGSSRNVLGRFGGHRGKLFDAVEIFWAPKDRIKTLEKSLIRRRKPILNYAHNNKLFHSRSISNPIGFKNGLLKYGYQSERAHRLNKKLNLV